MNLLIIPLDVASIILNYYTKYDHMPLCFNIAKAKKNASIADTVDLVSRQLFQ